MLWCPVGESKFFECTGFFIDHIDNCPTIPTSASLVRNPDGTDEIVEGLRVDAHNYSTILFFPLKILLSPIVMFAD
jgi:hypothetical protein